MLFRAIKRMILAGNTEGLLEKLDVFKGAGKLTQEEYDELVSML